MQKHRNRNNSDNSDNNVKLVPRLMFQSKTLPDLNNAALNIPSSSEGTYKYIT